MRLTVTCPCGAGITVEAGTMTALNALAERWHTPHACRGRASRDESGTAVVDLGFGFVTYTPRPIDMER